MISQRMQDALNGQINKELFSAYLYLSMAAYCETINFEGMANWMKVQSQEEMTHAMKIYNFINERGGRVILTHLDPPQVDWESPVQVFDHVLNHERYITSCIYDLVNIAMDERDHTTNIFLNWFVTEQAEEEDTSSKILEKFKMLKNSPDGMFLLDRELGTRTFQPAADAEPTA